MGISLVTSDLGAVFELIGATSACALAYIFPPLCYIKLSTRSWRTILAALCITFGCGVMSISSVLTVAKMIRSECLSPLDGGVLTDVQMKESRRRHINASL